MKYSLNNEKHVHEVIVYGESANYTGEFHWNEALTKNPWIIKKHLRRSVNRHAVPVIHFLQLWIVATMTRRQLLSINHDGRQRNCGVFVLKWVIMSLIVIYEWVDVIRREDWNRMLPTHKYQLCDFEKNQSLFYRVSIRPVYILQPWISEIKKNTCFLHHFFNSARLKEFRLLKIGKKIIFSVIFRNSYWIHCYGIW